MTPPQKSPTVGRRLSDEDKLALIKKAWGYAEVVQMTYLASGWKVFVVKNYPGKWDPSSPKVKKRREIAGFTKQKAIWRAYYSVIKRNGHTNRS